MNRTRRNWTDKEDALLRNSVQKELNHKRPLLWREIAKQIPGRSNKDCRKRWWNSLAGATAKGAWSPEEDRRLFDAVQKYGTNSWMKVAGAVGTRYGDQCSSHWLHVLNPNINYSDWTPEEDQQLLDAVHSHGTNWSTISSFHTPERTPLALKNQYWKLRQRTQNASKTAAAVTSSPPLSAITPTANSNGARLSAHSTSNVDDAEGEDDEDEDVDMEIQSDEGETHRGGKDIRASCPAEYPETETGSAEWMDEWTSFSMPQHMLMSSKASDPLGHLWTDLGDNSTSVVSRATSTSVSQHPATDLVHDEMYFSIMDDLQPFVSENHAEESSITDLLTPVSTAANLTSTTTSQSTQSKPSSAGKEANSCGSAASGDAILARARLSWPCDVRNSLKSVSVRFSCPAEQLSDIMTLVAGTGLNATIKIDSEEVPIAI